MSYNGTKSKLIVGQLLETPDGVVEIISYSGVMSVGVRFLETGYETTTQSGHILRGAVRDRLKPRFYGKGFQGVGPHKVTKCGKEGRLWNAIFNRCYGKHGGKTYNGISNVDPQWHNFQEFAEWCQWQVGFNEHGWHLEKDILVHGNQTYGPETCVFAPIEINSFILHTDEARGYTITRGGNFSVTCGGVYKGTFHTKEEAGYEYFKEKHRQSKLLADKYKGRIDERLYFALIERFNNYEEKRAKALEVFDKYTELNGYDQ